MAKLIVGENDLYTKNRPLAEQWHPTKNGALTPRDVMAGSSRQVWWMCVVGHEWDARISHRSAGRGCPYCSGRRILIGFNDLYTKDKALAEQWHPTLNGTLTPYDVMQFSGQKVHWMCKKGHDWAAVINDRSNGVGCPTCSGRRVLVGFNDLATTDPKLAKQWHPTLNGEITPQSVTRCSRKRVYWKCIKGHEWAVTITSRSKGNGCPKCAVTPVAGVNDLAPELVLEWHPTKNGKLTPQDVKRFSGQNAHWKCIKGHEWETRISSRSKGNGCPKCAVTPVAGVNDLAPELVLEWHPTKNGKLTPQDVKRGSNQNAHWKCIKGHEWESLICNRSAGSGCPKCCVRTAGITEGKFREVFEKFSQFDFKYDLIDLIRFSRKRSQAQIDMLNDNLGLVIEYDGEFAHGENALYKNTLEQKLMEDKETTQALVDSGRNVIRIREHAREGKLPFVPLDPEYETSVFQITYKSFGKDKDDIEELVQRIIEEKVDWFKLPSELMLATN